MIMLKVACTALCLCACVITSSVSYSCINKNLTGDLQLEIVSISNIYHS